MSESLISMTTRQSIDHLRAEIEFRKQLAVQHVTGEVRLPDYYGKTDHDAILEQRMRDTAARMRKLKDSGISLSPFLELGAERGQRSIVMVNDLDAHGFAADISWHQLRTAEHFGQLFDKPRMPLRVCCDLKQPPFRNNSFALAFCFEFLHHFPAPLPIMQQAARILTNGGAFYFAEEPFKRPRLLLYRRRHKIYARTARGRNKVLRYLERFFSESYSDELEFGVMENDRISLKSWSEAIASFDRHDVWLRSVEGRIRSRLDKRVRLRNLLNRLLGGGIEGLCIKHEEVGGNPPQPASIDDLLCCPDCMELSHESHESRTDLAGEQVGLTKDGDAYVCRTCETSFPIIEGISILLPTPLRRALYPEFGAMGAFKS